MIQIPEICIIANYTGNCWTKIKLPFECSMIEIRKMYCLKSGDIEHELAFLNVLERKHIYIPALDDTIEMLSVFLKAYEN